MLSFARLPIGGPFILCSVAGDAGDNPLHRLNPCTNPRAPKSQKHIMLYAFAGDAGGCARKMPPSRLKEKKQHRSPSCFFCFHTMTYFL